MMDVLNESFDTFSNFPFSLTNSISLLTRIFVTGKCLPQHRNKRAISREKDSMGRFMNLTSGSRDVQSNQSFPRTRDSADTISKKANSIPYSRDSRRYARSVQPAIGDWITFDFKISSLSFNIAPILAYEAVFPWEDLLRLKRNLLFF